jgi:hypothetical protein
VFHSSDAAAVADKYDTFVEDLSTDSDDEAWGVCQNIEYPYRKLEEYNIYYVPRKYYASYLAVHIITYYIAL